MECGAGEVFGRNAPKKREGAFKVSFLDIEYFCTLTLGRVELNFLLSFGLICLKYLYVRKIFSKIS